MKLDEGRDLGSGGWIVKFVALLDTQRLEEFFDFSTVNKLVDQRPFESTYFASSPFC